MLLVESCGSCEVNGFTSGTTNAPPPRGHGQGGRHVAPRWRIRHKLLLGLGVVVGIIAVLLTGTLYGLAAFTSTVRTAGSKIAELNQAELLKRQISGLRAAADNGHNLDDVQTRLRDLVPAAKETTAGLAAMLQDAIGRGKEVDEGGHEQLLVGDLQGHLDRLDKAIDHIG